MAHKKTLSITVDYEVYKKVLDLGYRGTISQTCEEALRNIIKQTKPESVRRLDMVPFDLLKHAKKLITNSTDPISTAVIWTKKINEQCDSKITALDLLRRFYPNHEWTKKDLEGAEELKTMITKQDGSYGEMV